MLFNNCLIGLKNIKILVSKHWSYELWGNSRGATITLVAYPTFLDIDIMAVEKLIDLRFFTSIVHHEW